MKNTDRMMAIKGFIERWGILNASQICRLMNMKGVNEYSQCYYTFREKPKGSSCFGCKNAIFKNCCYDRRIILYSCMRLVETGQVKTEKRRFWDSGGIGTDLFRFFYIEPKIYAWKITARAPRKMFYNAVS